MRNRWYQSFSKTHRIISAKVFFLIFFTKMLISATPMFVDSVDKHTILRVVLQIEIENSAKNCNANLEDLHENGVKVFKSDTIDFFNFANIIEDSRKEKLYTRNERIILSFHPSVPTPPPNC